MADRAFVVAPASPPPLSPEAATPAANMSSARNEL